ncbi:MAG: hydrogenase formation protein HypD [Patescibacteria group bacterium]|nr:hydrogenase formation protein HypD [Patescibacteria group bacterium]
MTKKSQYTTILEDIRKKALLASRPLTFMELCGTHSQTVAQHGIKNILPKNIKLVAGPGCPVCVTDQSDIDNIIGLALEGIPIATYGDVLKVPGNSMSLEKARAGGTDVSAVYDVAEALEIKKRKPDLVFFGMGFETTTPMTAWAVRKGLTIYSSHKRFFPAMETLLKKKSLKIDGFINPGHVSAITGTKMYEKLKVPQVVAGFEAIDVLRAISMLLDQILNGKHEVQNEYARVVKKGGNPRAQKIIAEVFEVVDANWRGLGKIKSSGLAIRKKYQKQNAEYVFENLLKKIRRKTTSKPTACKCGEVLQGLRDPKNCPLFAKICNPQNPQGPCMVSVEGTCSIDYKYGRSKQRNQRCD